MATGGAPPPTTDPADEAGGEVVFSSDGLAPTLISKPPAVPAALVREGDEEDVLESDDRMSPQLAFEVFQGKMYSALSNTATSKRSASSVTVPETPLVRLARLQQEVQEIEAQFSVKAGSGQDFDDQLLSLATTLKTQLTTLSSRIPEQDDLTRLIRQQLQSFETRNKKKEGASAPEETGVVYELYGNASNPTTTLEDRLVRLERAVGSQSTTAASSANQTLLQRLEAMEKLITSVDAVTLEQTTTKAKVIRADLEAASKARNKLTATYKKEDSKMIQQLHTQLVELEGLSEHLPALVERLQQLASLHVQAGTFSSRLEALETSANQLSSAVSQIEGSMDQLATNLSQNFTTLEGNLKVLDERLNKL